MYRFTKTVVALLLATSSTMVLAQAAYTNIGRPATAKEIAAWDIDVRPDFKGLPPGSGTVAKGMAVWEGKCASCHGTFGESNEVFTPIVGGTTKEDIKTGHVAALSNNKQPQRTTIMKVPTVSTLWDYINRAMPWTAPKSLTTEEVYAVTAYILNMAEILPDDFTLSDKNIAEVQQLMPNRNGMTRNHGMWDIKGKPDVKSVACMKDCKVSTDLRSTLPEPSRNAHGNIQLQNRTFGEVRGVDTTKPASTKPISAISAEQKLAMAAPTKPVAPAKADGLALAKQYACVACHGVSSKLIGPGFNEIAAKYKDDANASAALTGKIKNGSNGAWGPIPMPAQAHVKDEDIKTLVGWILGGAK
jgi:cytochrome c551/c552